MAVQHLLSRAAVALFAKEKDSSPEPFHGLDDDGIVEILKHLEPSDLARVAKTCLKLYFLSKDVRVFKGILQNRFKVNPIAPTILSFERQLQIVVAAESQKKAQIVVSYQKCSSPFEEQRKKCNQKLKGIIDPIPESPTFQYIAQEMVGHISNMKTLDSFLPLMTLRSQMNDLVGKNYDGTIKSADPESALGKAKLHLNQKSFEALVSKVLKS